MMGSRADKLVKARLTFQWREEGNKERVYEWRKGEPQSKIYKRVKRELAKRAKELSGEREIGMEVDLIV